MSSERPSMNNRVEKVARSFKKRLSSLFHSKRPRIPSSIEVCSSSGNHMAAADAGTSLPLAIGPVVRVDRALATAVASTEVYTVSSISAPISASEPAVHRQLDSVCSQGPEISPMHTSPITHSPMSLFQGAHNVYLHQSTINMANSIHHVSDGHEQSSSRNLIALSEKLLPRAQFAEYDAASSAPRNPCTENTRKAILDTLQVWANDNTTTNVYWLNGMAGTGKTTIAYSFSDILHEKDSLGGSFFCSHLRVDTSDVRCIIPTIALQLAKYLPSLSQLILNVVEANPECSSWRIDKQFRNFIVRPLTSACRGDREVVVVPVIVLDALDECSDQSLVDQLLSTILKHSASLPVKFFITSRPEISIKESFGKSWAHSNFILHEVENEVVKADIELYIKACLVDGQIWLNRHNWPPQAQVERLVNMSGTLFIYAATVCKYIAQMGSSHMPQRLSDVINFTSEITFGVTQPLDVLYKRILDTAYNSRNPRERSDIGIVLKAVVYVYNPLSMSAISGLVQLPIEQVENALSSLHSLIHIPSSQHHIKHISILHASFHDFISNQIHSSKYYLDSHASHRSLAHQCLSLMDQEWSKKAVVSYLAERRHEEISEALAYACDSWAFHFTYADNDNGSDKLKQFFQRHLLRWMDCLSILGKLGTAMHALYKLENWANTQNHLVIMVIDAKRFLKENFYFIKRNSLEGCPSALAWLPEKSDIWKTYGSRIECQWKLCVGRRNAWSLSEAVLEHPDYVNSVVFSPDGRHIVSACWDHTAWIWNTATGECEAELKGHTDRVNSAVFSPDGMHIVSASYDHTAHIWNTATGECETELKGHLGRVYYAVFSPDGMHIVSASDDCTARIWNTATGE
ncbi:hypothetical protein BYT27DRAFT_7340295, partial [Phlegmacium glaucopus]